MSTYIPTIGLEIHAELKTRTKMFCDCRNDPDEARPNINICPVCLAHPGTLPVINKEAVRHILRIGSAVSGAIADFTEFDRKSYFYPDIPKGYQISQYEHPLISGGSLVGVAITRVHLEEDTARSTHTGDVSLVDFNRAGIPLMELVTEPVMHDAETAGAFARELQQLLRVLGAGEANLEKGEMRIEANVSVSDREGVYGTKVEIKNLNSFRSVERAIAYEIKRQTEVLEKGGRIDQETRGWDEAKQTTFHQRFKEGSADYRYFPEPDLPKLYLSEIEEFEHELIHDSLPELPWDRRARYEALGLKKEYVDALVQNEVLIGIFEHLIRESSEQALVTRAANYLLTDIVGLMQTGDSEQLTSESFHVGFIALMRMAQNGDVSSRGAKDILAEMYARGGNPKDIAAARGLLQIHDEAALSALVDAVLKVEEKAVAEYRSGKEAALQYLVGKSMKQSGGAGNPTELRRIIQGKLS